MQIHKLTSNQINWLYLTINYNYNQPIYKAISLAFGVPTKPWLLWGVKRRIKLPKCPYEHLGYERGFLAEKEGYACRSRRFACRPLRTARGTRLRTIHLQNSPPDCFALRRLPPWASNPSSLFQTKNHPMGGFCLAEKVRCPQFPTRYLRYIDVKIGHFTFLYSAYHFKNFSMYWRCGVMTSIFIDGYCLAYFSKSNFKLALDFI